MRKQALGMRPSTPVKRLCQGLCAGVLAAARRLAGFGGTTRPFDRLSVTAGGAIARLPERPNHYNEKSSE